MGHILVCYATSEHVTYKLKSYEYFHLSNHDEKINPNITTDKIEEKKQLNQ